MSAPPVFTGRDGTNRDGRTKARRDNGLLRDQGRLQDLARLASDLPTDAIEDILAVAREQLNMDLAFVGEFTGGQEVFRAVEGDGGTFGIQKDAGIDLDQSYCQRMAECSIPNVIKDAKNDARVGHLKVTVKGDIGAYIGVPLRFSDGTLYGALCCVSHQADPSLTQRDARFMHVLARLMADQLERQKLEAENARLTVQATGARALQAVLQARDGYTGTHSEAVLDLTSAVAGELGVAGAELDEVRQVAVLHDIGKVGVPDSILRKEGPLDDAEWKVMKEHPVIGAQIVASIDGLSHLAAAIRAEHERWDGRGYPDGLAGEEIPFASRIVFACDAYHAMTSDRPYRRAMSNKEALAELERNAGTQFCPASVAALLTVLGYDSFR